MSLERLVSRESLGKEEENINWALRPTSLGEYVGQRELVEKLKVSLEAARKRGEPLEHTLLYGPPGLGKTTLAHIIAREMGTRMVKTAGPALVKAIAGKTNNPELIIAPAATANISNKPNCFFSLDTLNPSE